MPRYLNPLGAQELAALQFIADNGPLTVREMTDQYGAIHGLARTTLMTTMENLRKKGYLERSEGPNGFVYHNVAPKEQMLEGLVKEFVQGSLGGSLSPFVAYITNAKGLSKEEIEQLKKIVNNFDEKNGEESK